jgi:hypothetical protein
MDRRIHVMCALICACLLARVASAQNQSQRSPEQNAAEKLRPGKSCMFDPERGELRDCVHVQADGLLVVSPRYVKQLAYSRDGLAAVWIAGEWAYVNRRGIAIITGVPSLDNGPDEFHDGLVRVIKDKKYGFANRKGEVVIPPLYDGALPFENGGAKVCSGCVNKCLDPNCEHHMFSGGQWLTISTKGAVLK